MHTLWQLVFFTVLGPGSEPRAPRRSGQLRVFYGKFSNVGDQGPFLGSVPQGCRTLLGTQKGTLPQRSTRIGLRGFAKLSKDSVGLHKAFWVSKRFCAWFRAWGS